MSQTSLSSSATAAVLSDLGLTWADGTVVFDHLDVTIGNGTTGLIGANGCGKTTLLRLIAGDLTPTRGSVRVNGTIGYLPQHLTLDADRAVDDVLGVGAARQALRAVERGEAGEAEFAALGDDWTVEERARTLLDRLGLEGIGLDRRVGEVSGGEAILLGLAAHLLARPDILLLDEPTNNLDLTARQRLAEVIGTWPGAVVLVSHDRALLDTVDRIGELRERSLRWYGGNLTAYEQVIAAEQETAERLVRNAEGEIRRQQRELIESRTKVERRARQGRKLAESGSLPRIVVGTRQRSAQVSAGKHLIMQAQKVREARDRLIAAEAAVRDDDAIRVDLAATAVPAGRTVLTVRDAPTRSGTRLNLDVRGPERIALLGPNGAGKTTLLEMIAGVLTPETGTVDAAVPLRYLPQRLDILDERVSILDNLARLAPSASANSMRARLARFQLRGGRADQIVATLSGGERFRATLAALMLAEPAPQLLLLDEPTNSLDLTSSAQLGQALAGFRGALIIASHDVPFLATIGITRWLRLDEIGGLSEAS